MNRLNAIALTLALLLWEGSSLTASAAEYAQSDGSILVYANKTLEDSHCIVGREDDPCSHGYTTDHWIKVAKYTNTKYGYSCYNGPASFYV